MNQAVTRRPLRKPATRPRPPVAEGRQPWAIVLAGGEGLRLRALVEYVHGDHRPVQYASFMGSKSLLRGTLDRVAIAIAPERTVVIGNERHTSYLARELPSSAKQTLLLQPADCGTAAEILFPAHAISWRHPEAVVAVIPSDHFVHDDAGFMSHILQLARFVKRRPDRIVLVGVRPDGPESPHGWIEPGPPIGTIPDGPVLEIRCLGDRVSRETLGRRAADSLWNTLAFVASVTALVEMGRRRLPDLSERLARIAPRVDTAEEPSAIRHAYAAASTPSLSCDVFGACAGDLAVSQLPAALRWSDWATPTRVIQTLCEVQVTPGWLDALTRGKVGRDPAARHPVRSSRPDGRRRCR